MPVPLPVNHADTNQVENRLADESDMDIDHAPVKMVVLDGIVMGLQHCAYDNCTSDFTNAHGGYFCAFMKTYGGLDVICITLIMKRFLGHRHVRIMQESGINMLRIIYLPWS